MRKPRLKAPSRYPVAYYHCLSRVVGRQFLLGEPEKEQFVAFLREYERFCGVKIVTYCVMSDHFHVLLEVPDRPQNGLSDSELMRRLKGLSGMSGAATIEPQLAEFREQRQHKAAEDLTQKLMARMWDVSAFMKLLKQRFTQWFNHLKGRRGTLWEERFKSVLVEGSGEVLATLAAYIDLNPVRAGLEADPKNYRWCGYAAAVAGSRPARAGIQLAIRAGSGREMGPKEALQVYQGWVGGQKEATEGFIDETKRKRKGLTREAGLKLVAAKGRLPLDEYLRLRVRYFSDGTALGSRDFVEDVFASLRDRFGPKRKDGARRLKGLQSELYSLRALRVKPLG